MTFNVLFVCSANICRSPSAAVLFSKALIGTDVFGDLTVRSVGTDAVGGQFRCDYVRQHLDAAQPQLHRLLNGRASVASAKRVSIANLILCADRDAVGKILRVDPQVRPRAFTMIEAAMLSGRVVAESQGSGDGLVADVSPPRGDSGIERLGWLVAEMDAARGQIPLDDPGRLARLLRRPPVDPIEILDVHTRGPRAHKRMLREVGRVTSSLAEAVVTTYEGAPLPSGSPASS